MNLSPKNFGIGLLVILVVACALLIRGNFKGTLETKSDPIANKAVATTEIQPRSADHGAQPSTATRQPSKKSAREDRALTHSEWQSKLQSKLQRMDDVLREEPVSSSWSAAATKQITTVLTPESLAELGATQPESYQMDCRSSSCKISMSFQDSSAAENTVMALTTSIGNAFPEALVVPIQRPDGSAQYFVYASATKGSKLLSR